MTLLAAAVLVGSETDLRARELSFQDRVDAQRAIERVYHAHQIGSTRPFDQAVPAALLEEKVRTYLAQTVALRTFWRTPVTPEMLRREAERIARDSKLPDRARELFDALDRDPSLFEETVARATLVGRLARNFFSGDSRIHHAARSEIGRLQRALDEGWLDPSIDHPRRHVIEYVKASRGEEMQDGPVVALREPPDQTLREVLPTEEFARRQAMRPSQPGKGLKIEDEGAAFVVRVLLENGADTFRVATYAVPKRTWDSWWREVAPAFLETAVDSVAEEHPRMAVPSDTQEDLPEFAEVLGSAAPCPTADFWSNGSLATPTPDGLSAHTVVWTGSLMLVWGGNTFGPGARYDPLTDTWTALSSLGAPSPLMQHAAVWTGSRMIVWGGSGLDAFSRARNTGGRYDPVTDRWAPTSLVNAPAGRYNHTAVWTGREMIVWGGTGYAPPGSSGPSLNTGARYDPEADTWTATSTAGSPLARAEHTAIWTGEQMIVWGGAFGLDSGGRYEPLSDSWQPTSLIGAPQARYLHAAVWTGRSMVVWGGWGGGSVLDSGGRYDPAMDSWTPTSLVNAPVARRLHTAVWTGEFMIPWGGYTGGSNVSTDTGGRYDPTTDTWQSVTTTNAPTPRFGHSAVWSGTLMIVWGGGQDGTFIRNQTGGRYDPRTDTWTPTSTTYAPHARTGHAAVWTGNVMIIAAGDTGGLSPEGARYDPTLDTWTPLSTDGNRRFGTFPTAVWTGRWMVIWGGSSFGTCGGVSNEGARYDPVTDMWLPVSTTAAPTVRGFHTAVWTGRWMIVWGGRGSDCFPVSTGGRYDPENDTWLPTNASSAPAARSLHTAVWTGREMIVWGGDPNSTGLTNSGGRYDPASDTWRATSTVGAPANRIGHGAVWTGSAMIIWGGQRCCSFLFDDGGRYDPASDTWTAMSTAGAPAPRHSHIALWTGGDMIVWGGIGGTYLNTGGHYDPVMDAWYPTSGDEAPSPRAGPGVFTGKSMIVWGGWQGARLKTGGSYMTLFESTYYRDGDGDGHGDVSSPVLACTPPQGYVADGTDCSDANAAVWGTPSEARNLAVDLPSTLRWEPPDAPGAMTLAYDLLRSARPDDFGSIAVCVETATGEVFASDETEPPPGRGLYYLVRARNGCPVGAGPLGTNSEGAEIVGRDCP